jgi:hypothetical protein
MIADTLNGDARKVVHQSNCLHFDAENIPTEPLAECISEGGVLDDLVTGRDQTVVYKRVSGLSPYYLGLIAEPTAPFFSSTSSPSLLLPSSLSAMLP